MSERVPALLVMHADLGEALLRAAAAVYGQIEDVEVVSNVGLSREDLEREIGRRVVHWGRGGLVFTDFWGGSCHISGMAALRGHDQVIIVTGVNLPTILDYLHNRDQYAVADLAERLRRKGQESFRVQRGQPA